MLPAVLACLQQQHRSCCAKLHSCWAKALSSGYRYCLCQVYGTLNTSLAPRKCMCHSVASVHTPGVWRIGPVRHSSRPPAESSGGCDSQRAAQEVVPGRWALLRPTQSSAGLPAVHWRWEGRGNSASVCISDHPGVDSLEQSCPVSGME